MNQAVAHHEVLVESAVLRCHENAHAFGAGCRLIDEFEILDNPSAGIADVDDAHPFGVGRDEGSRIIGRPEIGNSNDGIRSLTATADRIRPGKDLTALEQDLVSAIEGLLAHGVVICLAGYSVNRSVALL